MHYILDIHHQTRQNILRLLENTGDEHLLTIPDGFRNNLLWNAGHVVVIQQMICYQAARLPMYIDADFIKNFRKGSSPADWNTVPAYDYVLSVLRETAEKFQSDFKDGRFEAIPPYATPYKMPFGNTVHTVREAIIFNNTHEAMHLGIMNAMLKLLR